MGKRQVIAELERRRMAQNKRRAVPHHRRPGSRGGKPDEAEGLCVRRWGESTSV